MERPLIKRISETIATFINKALLVIVYILGIGPTSTISKLARKDFLNLIPKNFNWEAPSGSDREEKMY